MSKPCGDCGVEPGQLHEEGCDVERCANCGNQRISCDCDPDDPIISGLARLPWTGEWPGVAECREYGFWCKMVPGADWVDCGPDDPEATEHITRLTMTCRWDRAAGRWARP